MDETLLRQLHELQSHCQGLVPLTARWEPWVVEILNNKQFYAWVDTYGSALNVLNFEPLGRNVRELKTVADDFGLNFRVFLARKANKAICFIDATLANDCGMDVASEAELRQALARGVKPNDVICTAAIKDHRLIDQCVSQRITLTIDNCDEIDRIAESAIRIGVRASVALRVSGFLHGGNKLYSRFGVDICDVPSVSTLMVQHPLDIHGLHFHLHDESVHQRVSAIEQSLVIATALKELGCPLRFLDIGGSVPMSYLGDGAQYQTFWDELKKALQGQREPITYGGHGLGMLALKEQLTGTPNVYAHYQPLVRGSWFRKILESRSTDGYAIGQLIARSGLQLRMEPGRSALDGCGITMTRVEHRKQHANGDWLIGCSMNRTQCRTTYDDFLVDPLLIPRVKETDKSYLETEISGYLVGAYCTESELLSLRKLRFPRGVNIGDLIVFPNTAGYLMHFLESRSHQFPLAANLVVSTDNLSEPTLDLIDSMADQSTVSGKGA